MRKVLLVLTPLSLFSICGLSTGHISAKESSHFILNDGDSNKKTNDSTSDSDVKHRKFEFSVVGANDQTHYGLRNNNLKLPYIQPGFTYTAKSGFYIGINDQYLILKGSKGGFDVFGVNPGYDWDISDNTTIDFNFQYYHFRKGTPNLIRGSLSSDLETYLDQYIYKDLEGRLTIDYDIYSAPKNNQPKTPNDFIFTPDLLYTFEWDFSKKNSLSFIPEASVDFGTRNFYTQYQNAVAGDSITKGYKPKKQNYASTSNSSFGLLDYNLILSIELSLGNFNFEPMITYNAPLYLPTGTTKNKPAVFGSITLSYTIKSKK